jgi:hypothetical protein
MVTQGGRASSADVKRIGLASGGHSHDALKRAKRQLGIGHKTVGFPGTSLWLSPSELAKEADRRAADAVDPSAVQLEQSSQSTARGESSTAPTESQAPTGSSWSSWSTSGAPEDPAPTAAPEPPLHAHGGAGCQVCAEFYGSAS